MFSRPVSLYDVAFVAAAILLVLAIKSVSSRHPPAPPGPKGLPLLGNILDFPPRNLARACALWTSTYGELTQLTLLTRPLLILHTRRAAHALLTANARLTSARPSLPTFGASTGWARMTALLPHGPAWRMARRLAAPVLGSRAGVAACEPVMAVQIPRVIPRLLGCAPGDSGKMREQMVKTIVGTTVAILYGVEIREEGDPVVHAVCAAMEQFSKNFMPGAVLADWLPLPQSVSRLLPRSLIGASNTEHWKATLDSVLDLPYVRAKEAIAEGNAPPSFISACLAPQPDSGAQSQDTDMDMPSPEEYEQIVKHAAASILIGATDSTFSLIETLLNILASHPNVQRTAQAELDRVLNSEPSGTDADSSTSTRWRLPVLADAQSTPYIRGLVLEVLRLGAALPLGMPHVLAEDTIYEGYLIKQGTTLLADIRGMLRDPDVYTDPDTCDPTRYAPSAKNPAGQPDPREVVWGFGKRTCPGLYLAETCLTLTVLHTLAAFDVRPTATGPTPQLTPTSRTSISNAKGEYSATAARDITREVEYTTGLVSHPVSLEVTLRPRSEDVLAAAREISAGMQKY